MSCEIIQMSLAHSSYSLGSKTRHGFFLIYGLKLLIKVIECWHGTLMECLVTRLHERDGEREKNKSDGGQTKDAFSCLLLYL